MVVVGLVTWVEDRERLEITLAKSGYEQIPVKEPFCNRQSDFRKNQVEVTFNYLTHTDRGQLIMNGLPE